MRLRFGGHRTPIGLDLGAHSIKAVQLLNRGADLELLAAVCVPRTEPGADLTRSELELLIGVLQRHGFIGSRVNAALQPAQMLASSLELPARVAGVPMEEIARAEFCRVNKTEPDGIVMSYWDLPAPVRAGRATYAMAVGCRASETETYLDLIESAGLDVQALDACGSAVARACFRKSAADDSVTTIVDLGWTAATLSILKSGVVVYDRRIVEAGMGALVESISQACGTRSDIEYVLRHSGVAQSQARQTDASELEAECRSRTMTHFARTCEELTQTLMYIAHRYAASDTPSLFLTGGGALVPGLAGFFEETLKLSVKTMRAGDVVQCPASLAGTMTEAMLAATGLALFEPQ